NEHSRTCETPRRHLVETRPGPDTTSKVQRRGRAPSPNDRRLSIRTSSRWVPVPQLILSSPNDGGTSTVPSRLLVRNWLGFLFVSGGGCVSSHHHHHFIIFFFFFSFESVVRGSQQYKPGIPGTGSPNV